MTLDDETLALLGYATAPDAEWLSQHRRTRGDFDLLPKPTRRRYSEMSEVTKAMRRASSAKWYRANREKALAAQRVRDAKRRRGTP